MRLDTGLRGQQRRLKGVERASASATCLATTVTLAWRCADR